MRKQKLKPFSLDQLNVWRMHRQWLDRPFKGRDPVALIRSTGWIHAPGTATPYLSLWARMQSFQAPTLDRLVFKDHKLVLVETLRGTTMLVPREQARVALRVCNRTFTELAEQAEEMLPLSLRQMEKLKVEILSALEAGPRSDQEILQAVPSHLVHEFPSTLRRIGMTGSVRLAINLLKEEGRIVKVLSGKRLDSKEHSYALLSSLLPEVDPFELKPELANTALAKLYFSWEGPARIKDFAWWSGLHVTEAMRAAESIQPCLKQLDVKGSDDPFWITETDLEALSSFKPSSPAVNLIPFRDVYLKGQKEVAGRFVPARHSDKPFALSRGRAANDPMATVIQDGRVVGVWEWTAEKNGTLDFALFDDSVPKDVEDLVEKRASKLSAFIRENLGVKEVRSADEEFGRRRPKRVHELKTSWSPPRAAHAGRA